MRPQVRRLLKRAINGEVFFGKDLKDHTTFKIGGKAAVWIEPSSIEDLRSSLAIIHREKMKPFFIGNGSNILASDGKIEKAFIRLSSPAFRRTIFGDDFVVCGAGCSLPALARRCAGMGFSGLEEFAGIPGTVGGAVMMNAGSGRKKSLKDNVEWVKVMDGRGRVSLLKKDEIKFSYRNSGLSGYIILEARFALKKEHSWAVMRRLTTLLKKKHRSQEYRYPNAGSVFKNPKGSRHASGWLIDRSGLKGVFVKGAQVSTRHANFIINRRNATFRDVLSLMRLVQRTVKKKYGIWLESEIEIVR